MGFITRAGVGFGFLGGGSDGGPSLDSDALAYLTAVEAADGQPLETGVRTAVNDFVVGLKADGLWNSLQCAGILCGARTLNGILVPLRGPTPTNNNFVSGDYNRKTGLIGNGSTKWIDTNFSTASMNRNNNSCGVFVTQAEFATAFRRYLAADIFAISIGSNTSSGAGFRNWNPTLQTLGGSTVPAVAAISRPDSTSIDWRIFGQTGTVTSVPTQSETDRTVLVFASNNGTSGQTNQVAARMAFYWTGASMNLTTMANRLNTFYADIGVAIP